jgi:hypothetical protein
MVRLVHAAMCRDVLRDNANAAGAAIYTRHSIQSVIQVKTRSQCTRIFLD